MIVVPYIYIYIEVISKWYQIDRWIIPGNFIKKFRKVFSIIFKIYSKTLFCWKQFAHLVINLISLKTSKIERV